jgi:hypothetical protein
VAHRKAQTWRGLFGMDARVLHEAPSSVDSVMRAPREAVAPFKCAPDRERLKLDALNEPQLAGGWRDDGKAGKE